MVSNLNLCLNGSDKASIIDTSKIGRLSRQRLRRSHWVQGLLSLQEAGSAMQLQKEERLPKGFSMFEKQKLNRSGSAIKRFLGYFILIFCLVMLGGIESITAKEPLPVEIGALYNLSGNQAELDILSSRGALLAVDQMNRKGGVLGRPVRLIMADGESKPAVIAKKTAELIEKNPSVSALMGLSDTDMVMASAPVAAKNGRLFLTSGATSPQLPSQVPEYLFLACFGDNVQAAAGAEWAYQYLSARTAAVLFNSTQSYTRLLQGYFQTRFKELGGRVVSMESYTPDTMRRSIQRLSHTVDLVYFSAMPEDAPRGVALMRRMGISAPILGGDAFDSEDLWQKHRELGSVFFTTHAYLGLDNPDPQAAAFRKAYVRAYPGSTPTAFAALGYDAARLIMAAVADAGSSDPDDVRHALSGIRRFQGVTGTISYPAGGRIPSKSVSILHIERGQRRLVRNLLPARVPSP
jgi:branched-chain amino acid transport system substrate-binding protein